MDRTALLHRATEVRRQIFASLPWEFRVAYVFTRIALETGHLDIFGRLIAAEMLKAGVEGMPEPGPKWNAASPKAYATLPAGYGGKFITDVYGLLMSHFGQDPHLAQDAILRYATKLGKTVKLKPLPRVSAESFIKHGIFLEARTLARKKLREQAHMESLEDVPEEHKGIRRDIPDPHALPGEEEKEEETDPSVMWAKWMRFLKEHERKLKPREWATMAGFLYKHHPHVYEGWMRALATIHPDMPEYFKLLIEGHDSADIVGRAPTINPTTGEVVKPEKPTMLKHYTPKDYDPVYWDKSFLRKLVPVSEAFFAKQHEQIEDAPPPPV